MRKSRTGSPAGEAPASPPVAAVQVPLPLLDVLADTRPAEYTNFRFLVGEVRGALAERMLSRRMTVAEVAERPGHAEVASFSHAFKR